MADQIVSGEPGGSFFGGFFDTLGETFSGIAQNLLPIWAADQLGIETVPPNQQPTYNWANSPPSTGAVGSTSNAQSYQGNARPTQAGLLFDQINISSTGLILIAGAAVALVILLRR